MPQQDYLFHTHCGRVRPISAVTTSLHPKDQTIPSGSLCVAPQALSNHYPLSTLEAHVQPSGSLRLDSRGMPPFGIWMTAALNVESISISFPGAPASIFVAPIHTTHGFPPSSIDNLKNTPMLSKSVTVQRVQCKLPHFNPFSGPSRDSPLQDIDPPEVVFSHPLQDEALRPATPTRPGGEIDQRLPR